MHIPHESSNLLSQEKHRCLSSAQRLCRGSHQQCLISARRAVSSSNQSYKKGPPVPAPCQSCGVPNWRKAQDTGSLPVALWRPMSVALVSHQGSWGSPINPYSNPQWLQRALLPAASQGKGLPEIQVLQLQREPFSNNQKESPHPWGFEERLLEWPSKGGCWQNVATESSP